MTSGTILVEAHGVAQRIDALGMRCDAKEIPDPLGNEKPVGWWIGGKCTISGSATAGTLDGRITPVKMQGTVAVAVMSDRLLGIFSTDSKTDPAIWFSWSIPELHIETGGSVGIFKKRPSHIAVVRQDTTLIVAYVARLYRNINRSQSGQEQSFLNALGVTV